MGERECACVCGEGKGGLEVKEHKTVKLTKTHCIVIT